MQRGTIFSIAGFCGLGAFLWTLAMRPPAEPPSLANAARSHIRRPRPNDRAGLERWMNGHPEEYEGWWTLAELRRNDGEFGKAQEAWARAVAAARAVTEQNISDSRACFALGWASDHLNDPEAAGAAYARARELLEFRASSNPDFYRFWHRLGWCRMKAGDREGAETAWARAVELLDQRGARGSSDPDAALMLLRDLALLGRKEDAIALLEHTAFLWDPAVLEHDECLASLRGTDAYREAVRAGRKIAPPRTLKGG